jgi:DNA polymerase-3 subunit delta
MNFNQFKQTTLPVAVIFDTHHREQTDIPGTASGSKKETAGDLVIAPNPRNPYPVFQAFLKSENFSLAELIQTCMDLNLLDFRIKSESVDPGDALKHFIVQTCIKEN